MKNLKRVFSFKPHYHFFPITGWINDPNGLIYWKGMYHMFYQYNPKSPSWGHIHWGHAVSKDLVHWFHLPVALYPKDERSGIFSGSAVEDNGKLKVIYTFFRDPEYHKSIKEVQYLAESSDGINFQEYSNNPIISTPPESEVYAFRDPKVRRSEKGSWEMVLGSGKNGNGRVLFYTSTDLINWHYRGVLFEGDFAQVFECPDLISMGRKEVLIYSACTPKVNGTFFVMGTVWDNKLIAENFGMLDVGHDYYAAQTFFGTERKIVIAWMQNPSNCSYPTQQEGWNGLMAIPRELHVENNELKIRPVEEVKQLRINEIVTEVNTKRKKSYDLNIEHNSYEIVCDFSPDVYLRLHNTWGESVEISTNNSILKVDTRRSGVSEGTIRKVEFKNERQNHLRVFVDSCSIEIFLNESIVCSFRIHPEYVYNILEFEGGSLHVYKLENIWLPN
ncbi:MAG: beta-fructofuranosidase [Thermotogota bacterium]|nr:beta-fructofuranosidase [Thermotogota bacterium]